MSCEGCESDRPVKVPSWVWWAAAGVVLVAVSRRNAPALAAPVTTSAECLRALVFPTAGADRLALLHRYQASEGLPPSGWNMTTAARAEIRLSDFPNAARSSLNSAMTRDDFFTL